jgi:isoquinoline 1-oxidoreductase alpha subunit
MNASAVPVRPGDEPLRRSAYNVRMPQAPQTPPATIVPEPIRKGIDVSINGKHFRHTGDPAMPLLWYLRDTLRLTGCKYGCDDKSCGACSVLVDGKLERACALAMADLADKEITTIEGLAKSDGTLHPVQQAWLDEDAILCGYCQAGQIMAAVDLLSRKPKPSDTDIDGIANLCRCGSYPRIRRAIQRAGTAMQGKSK